METYQLEIEDDANINSIGGSFALFASAVLHNRFPKHDDLWASAMKEVARVIIEHADSAVPESGFEEEDEE